MSDEPLDPSAVPSFAVALIGIHEELLEPMISAILGFQAELEKKGLPTPVVDLMLANYTQVLWNLVAGATP